MRSNLKYLGVFLAGLALMGAGCLSLGGWSPFGNDPLSPGAGLNLDNDPIFDLFQDEVAVKPQKVKKKHTPMKTECPQKLDSVKVSAPEGSTFQVDEASVPQWLSLSSTSGPASSEIGLDFNCNVPNFNNQEAKVGLSIISPNGELQVDSFFDVLMELE